MLRCFEPIAGENPRVLILGTFPSPQSRERGEYYGNPRNQFWRLMYGVLGARFDSPDYSDKVSLLKADGVALWDVIASCEAEGALDSGIRSPVYNISIPKLASDLGVSEIWFNGGNAYNFYRRGVAEAERRVLPSSSPANARTSFDEKLRLWRERLNLSNIEN